MKKIIILAFLAISTLCYSQEKDLKLTKVLVSIENQNGLPFLIVTDYNSYVLISALTVDGYKTMKFDYTQDFIERGLGSYNDYIEIFKNGSIKYRVLGSTENNRTTYKVIFETTKNTNVVKKEFFMNSILN